MNTLVVRIRETWSCRQIGGVDLSRKPISEKLALAFSLFSGAPTKQIRFRAVDCFIAHHDDEGKNQNAAQGAGGGKERRIVVDEITQSFARSDEFSHDCTDDGVGNADF